MEDTFGRKITYLRLSVTDKCNLRCIYCMPIEGKRKLTHNDVLTNEELVMVCKAAVTLGIKKIRVTGGEPLIRKNIINVLEEIGKIDGIEELCLTTNGVLLKQYAKDLYNVGVDRINISMDTLDDKKYHHITRIGDIKDVREGLDEIFKYNFKRIKINTVLIGGFNDDEIENLVGLTYNYDVDVRFIELMPINEVEEFTKKSYIKGDVVLSKFSNYKEVDHGDNIARLYKLDGAKGNFGIITPLSNHFCKECNRIRVTFDGKVKPCLHSNDEISLKGLDENGMKDKLMEAILRKPEKHEKLDIFNRSKSKRNMNAIGG